jgi:hypothetical protein
MTCRILEGAVVIVRLEFDRCYGSKQIQVQPSKYQDLAKTFLRYDPKFLVPILLLDIKKKLRDIRQTHNKIYINYHFIHAAVLKKK